MGSSRFLSIDSNIWDHNILCWGMESVLGDAGYLAVTLTFTHQMPIALFFPQCANSDYLQIHCQIHNA